MQKLTGPWDAIKKAVLKLWQSENFGYMTKVYVTLGFLTTAAAVAVTIVGIVLTLLVGVFSSTVNAQTLDIASPEVVMEETAPTYNYEEFEQYLQEFEKYAEDLDENEKYKNSYEASTAGIFSGIVMGLVGIIVGALVAAFTTTLFIYVVIAISEGNIILIRDLVKKSWNKTLPMLGLKLVMGIIILVGLALFVIPGIIAMVLLVFATIILVTEETGVLEAIEKSIDLTKNFRFQLFFRGLAILVLMFLILTAATVTTLAATFIFGGGGSIFSLILLTPLLGNVQNLALYNYYKEIKGSKGSVQPVVEPTIE